MTRMITYGSNLPAFDNSKIKFHAKMNCFYIASNIDNTNTCLITLLKNNGEVLFTTCEANKSEKYLSNPITLSAKRNTETAVNHFGDCITLLHILLESRHDKFPYIQLIVCSRSIEKRINQSLSFELSNNRLSFNHGNITYQLAETNDSGAYIKLTKHINTSY